MIFKKDLKTIWAQVPPDYYEQGIANNPFQRLWHSRKWAVIKKMLTGNYSNILDVGCASGWLTARVAKKLAGSRVTGIDVSSVMISHAKTKYPGINFIYGDAHHLPFPDNSYDLIICTEVLEHVVDPLCLLLEIRRCLSSDGEAIISMDTGSLLFKFIWAFWIRTKGKVWQDAHLHEFNKNKLKNLFKKANFDIREENISHLGMAMTFKLTKKML